jgi:hypothetical protein
MAGKRAERNTAMARYSSIEEVACRPISRALRKELVLSSPTREAHSSLRSFVTGKNHGLESDEGYYQDAGGVKADWYFRAFPIGWVRSNFQEGAIEVGCFRVWTHEFTKRFVRDSVFWSGFLGVTSALEGLFPRTLSYFGHYVMYRVRK